MEESLPDLPPLELVMKTLRGESQESSSLPHLVVEHCPIMRRHAGDDDEIHILSDRIVCEHIVEGSSSSYGTSKTGEVDTCKFLVKKYEENSPANKCPYYESYVRKNKNGKKK
ncbi:MAG: hypothetical protein Q8P81_00250 [Nanoarchaeota archaeon]|nr:hypothetical protein [Nanoarchaeota archaeon]